MAKNIKSKKITPSSPKTQTISKIKAKIDKIVNNSTKFKIGKTGLKLKDRLKQTDYSDYESIGLLYDSTNKSLINGLEAKLITYAMKKYPKKCNNRDDESFGDMNDDAPKIYRVYIVFKSITKKKETKS